MLTFALSSAITIGLSIWATSRSHHRAAVIEVAARQRNLAERYVDDVLLLRDGHAADPQTTAEILSTSAHALLEGGTAPSVNGDDDEITLPPAAGTVLRRQLEQEVRLVNDLIATGNAVIAGRPVATVPQTADENVLTDDPIERLRVIAALTSNVSLDASRTIAAESDNSIQQLVAIQVALGVAGLAVSLMLALALIAATRRQTAHFHSIVTSSTDLVLVLGEQGCRYLSQSVLDMVGREEDEMLGAGYLDLIHGGDHETLETANRHGRPPQIVFRLRNRFGEWRNIEANVTDLRRDRRIRGVVLNGRDVTERVGLERELTHQAYHDGLTGLANRALFRDRLDHALSRSVRTNSSLAVLLVDLDGFKQVNDSLGHTAGDELLREVAERFAAGVRPGDTVARFGGDEFAVLLEDGDEARAVMIARRLLERLVEPASVAGVEISLGASIGIALHSGDEGSSEELIRDADVAMYEAKEGGRGRLEVFRHEMGRELGESLGLEHELRVGLQEGEFSVHYQPEIDLASEAVVGVEALLRWTSPTRGPVPPSRFIPVAEATGLIMLLGEFVLREACGQTVAWRDAGLLPESFVTWVNLSGRQLTSGGVNGLVQQVLAETGLEPGRLGLEVTETAIVQPGVSGERARLELQGLHSEGVRIAIDDFGTGFSSLGQLRHFPVDMIKVDRSFVQGVQHDAKDAAITANVVSLAHALGLVAIAEGIESDSQLRSMRELGCDLAQGYLFARPAPADEVTATLRDARGGWTQAA